jgi:RNA polymerase sigma-70 factor (ECF subfamily)
MVLLRGRAGLFELGAKRLIGLRAALPPCLPALRSHARALCRDHAAADDLMQDTILRALAAEEQWQPGTELRAWLFTIQRNAWLARLRRRGREARHAATLRPPPDSHQPDTLAVRDLDTAMALLPAVQREALILVGGQGMDVLEAAAICGVAEGTIKARLSRGRAALRRILIDGI